MEAEAEAEGEEQAQVRQRRITSIRQIGGYSTAVASKALDDAAGDADAAVHALEVVI